MKKRIGILCAVLLALSMTACNVTNPNQFGVPWTAASTVGEYTEYDVKIEKIAESDDLRNVVVAEGTQKTYLRRFGSERDDAALFADARDCLATYDRTDGAGAVRYANCLVLTTVRTLTYTDVEENVTRNDEGVIVTDRRGKADIQQDEVVFSCDTHSLMQTRHVVSTRICGSDPTLNYACEALFGNGLTVRRFAQDGDGAIVVEDSAPKVSATYSFKARKVAATTYDNAQLLFVTRYASGFGKDWSGSFHVVNLAEICYTGGLADATFSISAGNESRPVVPDDYDDSALGAVSLASVNSDGEHYIPCVHTTFSRSGSIVTSYGPQFFADYASARTVETGVELANVLVKYQQFIPYTDVNKLTENEFVCEVVLHYAARAPRTAG